MLRVYKLLVTVHILDEGINSTFVYYVKWGKGIEDSINLVRSILEMMNCYEFISAEAEEIYIVDLD